MMIGREQLINLLLPFLDIAQYTGRMINEIAQNFHYGFCGGGGGGWWWQSDIELHALHTKFDLLNIFNYSNQKSNTIVLADEL